MVYTYNILTIDSVSSLQFDLAVYYVLRFKINHLFFHFSISCKEQVVAYKGHMVAYGVKLFIRGSWK